MRPWLRNGETLRVSPVPGSRVGPGDIVLYDLHGRLLLHRVWLRLGRRLWIKDDTASLRLHCIRERQVRGLLASARPFSRGWPGLAWSLLGTCLYGVGRRLKTALAGPRLLLVVAARALPARGPRTDRGRGA